MAERTPRTPEGVVRRGADGDGGSVPRALAPQRQGRGVPGGGGRAGLRFPAGGEVRDGAPVGVVREHGGRGGGRQRGTPTTHPTELSFAPQQT